MAVRNPNRDSVPIILLELDQLTQFIWFFTIAIMGISRAWGQAGLVTEDVATLRDQREYKPVGRDMER